MIVLVSMLYLGARQKDERVFHEDLHLLW